MYGSIAGQRYEPLSLTVTVRGQGAKPYTLRVPMASRVRYEIQREFMPGVQSFQQIQPLQLAGRLESFTLDVDYPTEVRVEVGDDPDAENLTLRKALETIRGVETNPDAPQFMPGLAMAALEWGWPYGR
jgi:hypothetical protein